MIEFSRVWAMPDHSTFSCKPIGEFVDKYIQGVSIDPYARDSRKASITNDINPHTSAQFHMEATDFLDMLIADNTIADCVIFDPPYSPRQITECYADAGLTATMKDTQSAASWKKVRARIREICRPGSFALSFGWNSCGMGRGFEVIEIMLVAHGGAHNDTICVAEKMIEKQEKLF